MKRCLQLELDQFGREAVGTEADVGGPALDALTREAVYYYVSDADSGRQGWRYPRFRRGAAGGGEPFEVTVDADEATWRSFSEFAAAQDVSPSQLLEHALLYYLADVDAGRVTARILGD